MTDSRAEKAARNNAAWCDTVCRTHGAPGEFQDAFWFNRHPVPRFYPNVVTLTQDGSAAQLAQIQTMVATKLPVGWGVKDSFNSLDLTALGFQPVFEATWLWHTPSPRLPKPTASGLRWTYVKSGPELAKWETAWIGELANNSSAKQPRLFLPSLLANPEIAFIAAYENERLVAGAIANHTDDVVGLSNVFAPPDNPQPFWTGYVAVVQERFPDLPIVGYERGPQLAVAQEIGFETLQPLKVWTRQA
jgi:hypothetical protein